MTTNVFDTINGLPILEVLDTFQISYTKNGAGYVLRNKDGTKDSSFSIDTNKNIITDFGKTGISGGVFDFIGQYVYNKTKEELKTNVTRAEIVKIFIDKGLITVPNTKKEFVKSLSNQELLEQYDNLKLNGYKSEISGFLMQRGVSSDFIQKNHITIGEVFKDIGFYDNYFCTEFETYQDENGQWITKQGDNAKNVSVFMFPCYHVDSEGKKELVGLKLRRKDGKTIRGKKSLAIGKTGILYDEINKKQAIIVEGEMDYIILRILGFSNIIGNLAGVQSAVKPLKNLLYNTEDIICIYDNDIAGMNGMENLQKHLNKGISSIKFPIRENHLGEKISDVNDLFKCGYDTKNKWKDILATAKLINEEKKINSSARFIYIDDGIQYYDTKWKRFESPDKISKFMGLTGKELFARVSDGKIPQYEGLCYLDGGKEGYYNTLDKNSIIQTPGEEEAILHPLIDKLINNVCGDRKRNADWLHASILYKLTHLNDVNLPAVILYGAGGCVDEETEFLTPNGWKKISDYNSGDIVGEYNKETGKCEFKEPLNYIKEEDNRLAYKIKGNRIDMFLTEEHTIPYKSNKGHWNKTTMGELYNKLHQKITIEGKSDNGSGYNIISNFKPSDSNNGIALNDIEIQLMVAVIADGYILQENTKRVRIRVKKEAKKNRLRDILNKYGKYTETDELSNPGYTNFYFNAPRIDKNFTEYYWGCNSSQLKVIYDEFVYWDGYIDYRNGHKIFTTTSKESSDFIQYVISTCSNTIQSTSIHDRIGETRVSSNGKEYTRKSIDYTVRETGIKSGSAILYKHITREYLPNRTKYCFTTTTGNWIARRGNYIFVTGNSGKGTFINLLSKIFGKENTLNNLKQRDLESSFDSYQGEKLIVEFQEIISGNTMQDKKTLDRIKSMVGEKQITINVKNQNIRTVDNIARFHFSSNHPVPIQLDSKQSGNRRFTIIKTGGKLNTDVAYKINEEIFTNQKIIRQYVGRLYETFPDVPKMKTFPALDNEEKKNLEVNCESASNLFFEWVEETYPYIIKLNVKQKNILLHKYCIETGEEEYDQKFKQKNFDIGLSHKYEKKTLKIGGIASRGYFIHKSKEEIEYIRSLPETTIYHTEFKRGELERAENITF